MPVWHIEEGEELHPPDQEHADQGNKEELPRTTVHHHTRTTTGAPYQTLRNDRHAYRTRHLPMSTDNGEPIAVIHPTHALRQILGGNTDY